VAGKAKHEGVRRGTTPGSRRRRPFFRVDTPQRLFFSFLLRNAT
jgi:hypothetical protein